VPAHSTDTVDTDSVDPPVTDTGATGGRVSLSARLYRGQLSFDFIRHRRRWYAVSGALLLLAVLGFVVRGLNLSVDFTGGNVLQVVVPATSTTTAGQVSQAVEALGVPGAAQPVVTLLTGQVRQFRVQTGQTSGPGLDRIQNTVAATVGRPADQVSVQAIGSAWGSEITRKALISLVVFLALVTVYLALAFEPKMGIAAILSLVHDLVITVGVYALVGFEVSPATVIGVLTILGYSLYDTVVVFDKVRENTRGIAGGSRATYSEAANLALNQTLVRSLNTTLIALLPIVSILLIGTAVLGPGVLEDLALALAVGMAVGAYSSIFIATPLLAQLHEREPAMVALARRVRDARAAGAIGGGAVPAPAGVTVVGSPVVGSSAVGSTPAGSTASGSTARPPRRPRPPAPPDRDRGAGQ